MKKLRISYPQSDDWEKDYGWYDGSIFLKHSTPNYLKAGSSDFEIRINVYWLLQMESTKLRWNYLYW